MGFMKFVLGMIAAAVLIVAPLAFVINLALPFFDIGLGLVSIFLTGDPNEIKRVLNRPDLETYKLKFNYYENRREYSIKALRERNHLFRESVDFLKGEVIYKELNGEEKKLLYDAGLYLIRAEEQIDVQRGIEALGAVADERSIIALLEFGAEKPGHQRKIIEEFKDTRDSYAEARRMKELEKLSVSGNLQPKARSFAESAWRELDNRLRR
jgi:hypothetical protein